MRIGFLLTLAMITSLLGACASQDPDAGSGDRNEVVATVLARIEADLGKPVKFEVQTLNIADGWALVDGTLQDTNGQPVDYRGTKFAQEAANGTRSQRYNGLLKKTGPKWTILEHAIGPTDVRWTDWKPNYSDAPTQIWP
ncbi:MAG: hypothetical protein ACRDUS_20855 [Mycobacterium sp.]